MTFWICRSCRHSFPSDLLEQASFTDHVGKRFGEMRDVLSSLLDGKANLQHSVHEALITLEDLCAAVHEEVGMLTEKLKKAKMGYPYDEKNGSDQPAAVTEGKKNLTRHAKKATDSSKELPPALAARGQFNSNSRSNANAAALTSMMASSSIPEYNRRKMCTAFELVSASVYSILESLAVHTRVDAAFLWIRPRGAITNELVAPFVVGRDLSKLAHSAPYRLTENSIPCVVADTGIAINIKPISGVRDQRPNGNIPLAELIERTNAAQLLTPVYTRYWSKDRSVIGVIHLIGSPRFPFPFNRRNEEVAAVASNLLSVVLSSHYDAMILEWANHFYDPSILHNTSSYRGDLDLQGDTKGVDDFASPAMLIYRETKESNDEANSRDASKALRLAMMRQAMPLHPIAHVRDLQSYAAKAEENWEPEAETMSRLENILQTQSEEGSVQGVVKPKGKGSNLSTSVRRNRDRNDDLRSQAQTLGMMPDNFRGPRASLAEGIESPGMKNQATEGHDDGGNGKRFSFSISKNRPVLKPEELTEIELAALQRLKSMDVDTTPLTGASF
ncbi:unnamed protein product [Phytomonas sp. EM1]|nr:unnamed protein product [Phytomonas sp. EM1]|eukprot:CCW63230.1 unnamed protein product [Phytomonas sp. isolate EM1]